MSPVRDRRAAGSFLVCVVFLLLLVQGPNASASAGSFAPSHRDVGVDTNGDRLFNYLRIDASLQVTTPGVFTVKVVLNDDMDLGKLTEASVTVSLAGGAQMVGVLLDGPDIYNGGVDGPYYAHLTLESEYGETLATGVHATAAYGFSDFQPYAARLVSPNSEKTWDNDTDGLVNWIDLGFTIDVATAGTYTLSSLLTDSMYLVSDRWSQARYLGTGRSTLHQLFAGYPLRLVQRSGPYMVTNSLLDSRGTGIDFAYVETKAYDYAIFEGSPVLLAPPYTDHGVDSDGDGLYNSLQVDVQLSVEASGAYSLRGQLVGTEEVPIASTSSSVTLGAGSATVSLSFEGWAIHDSGVSGPYRVDLQAFDSSLLLLAAGNHTSAAYPYGAFQPRLLFLTPPHEDMGVDLDGNGKPNVLRLSVHLNATRATRTRVEAALRQGVLAPDLVRVAVTTNVTQGAQVVALDFPGAKIAASGLDGPYWAVISVYGPNESLLDQGNHRTQAYLASDFDVVMPQNVLVFSGDHGEDIDRNGLYNRLRVSLSVNATMSGRYRLEGILSRDAAPITTAACVMSLLPGSGVMDLVFGGQEIRAGGRDGPYSVHAVLTFLDENVSLASADFTTSSYLASSFERVDSVSLAGQVVSMQSGMPLAGASVWLLDYVNYTSRQTVADSHGRFTLSAFQGTYLIVVDHPEGNALLLRQNLAGNTSLTISLSPPARTTVRDTLTWSGWDTLLISVRYAFGTDGPAYRLRSDWWNGNRDGWLVPSEWPELREPADTYRDVIEGGSSTISLSVNGVSFGAVGGAMVSDFLSGDVLQPSVPALEVSRVFRSQTPIGTPDRLEIVFDVYYDTLSVDRTMRLLVPGQYRYVSVSDAPDISVRTRKYLPPIYVEPDVGANLTEPPSLASVRMFFYVQPTYAVPTPAAPSGLAARVTGSTVLLTWSRPTTNVDGSRLADLAGYRIYRWSSSLGVFTLTSGPLLGLEQFADQPGVGIFDYWVTAVNTDGAEGPRSASVSATVQAALLLVTVVDTEGAPVAGARITLLDPSDVSVAQSMTDAVGDAVLQAPPGSYVIRVVADGIVDHMIPVELWGGTVSVSISVQRGPSDRATPLDSAGVVLATLAVLVGTVALMLLRRLRRKRGRLVGTATDSLAGLR